VNGGCVRWKQSATRAAPGERPESVQLPRILRHRTILWDLRTRITLPHAALSATIASISVNAGCACASPVPVNQ
jgi:hypothetical protein